MKIIISSNTVRNKTFEVDPQQTVFTFFRLLLRFLLDNLPDS